MVKDLVDIVWEAHKVVPNVELKWGWSPVFYGAQVAEEFLEK